MAALACFSCVVARRAAAEEAPAPSAPHSVSAVQHGPTDARVPQGFTEDHLALLAHIGIGAPAGALGGDVDVMPVPEVALRLGAGLSFNGPQFSFMPRARIPIGKREHFTLGTGASVGRYDNYGAAGGLGCLLLCVGLGEGPARQTFARALWWNLEIGFDAYAPR
ncbi:MAG TPA: hypothetical protein VEQ59_05355, partial [Polyangiaceae bacterium]|nr:hypothetical protein [Polyangiaceae bacterium]